MSIAPSIQIWTVESPEYPRGRLSCLDKEIPAEIRARGTISLLKQKTLALLCSAKAPASILLAVHDLAQKWRHSQMTIISGFHAPVEQEALTVLLREPGQVIICPARGLPQRIKPAWQTPLAEGRLAVLSPFTESVRRGTKETAIGRNRFVAALADEVLIAYAHPGSSTEQLAQELLAWGKQPYTLSHPANAHLHQLGLITLPDTGISP